MNGIIGFHLRSLSAYHADLRLLTLDFRLGAQRLKHVVEDLDFVGFELAEGGAVFFDSFLVLDGA